MSIVDDGLRQPEQPERCQRCNHATTGAEPFCRRCGFDLRHGQTKIPRSGICAYCEKHGPLTWEHLLPDWLNRAYTAAFKKRAHVLGRPESYAFFETARHHEREVQRIQGDYEVQVRNVCEQCNTGWMRELTDEAKPLVNRLADGWWSDFSEYEQITLARWSAMIAVSIEHYARLTTIPQFHRTKLMHGEMPPGWRVSIAMLVGPRTPGFHHYQMLKVPIMAGEDFIQIQNSYFCVEKVAFHCMSSSGDRVLDLGLLVAGTPRPYELLRSVWPSCDPASTASGLFFTWDELDEILGFDLPSAESSDD